ncbi:protein FAM124A isoform X2 [Cynoglossus semilaevis]|uniref:Family with sequence similarity 124 member A n=1 Tax=Cynoglossus semilaevis TaxID=244447 RepID=A0A3P8V7A6_CYNSE|nr:protein FAM124A isoform X2 [Cynoglossus semilaevis]
MEKTSAEDDCVDSGAETGGSDYSPLSTTSSELSMGELQDPFLVSVHLIADPGQGRFLQHAVDAVLAWVHPELQLFRVSERASVSHRPWPKNHQNGNLPLSCQPSLAVILFLQEGYGGEEQILMLHQALQRPPWRYHHTEKVSNGRRMLPLTPCSQDFFTLSPGTPLWAVRQVHYGKEIVRFTLYCRYENYVDMVRLYKLLLQRRVSQKKEDFCFFVVYSNPDMEIQISFKRLPRAQNPLVLESAVMEVRVRDVGVLVPLLPHPCSPISDVRWQTEDYDGNKILLQVQSSGARLRHRHLSSAFTESASAPSTFTRPANCQRNRRYLHRVPSQPWVHHQTSYSSLPLACEEHEEHEEHEEPEQWSDQEQWSDRYHPDPTKSQWAGHRSSSLFSLPNLGSVSSHSTCSSPVPCSSPHHHRRRSHHRSSTLLPQFRINVDSLIGAEETDVDTGDKVNIGSTVDLSVVSAYVQPNTTQTSRPSSAPPEDNGPPLSPTVLENTCRAATLGRIPISTSSTLHRSYTQSTNMKQLDSCSIISSPITDADYRAAEEEVEEEQEFYI